MTATEYTNVNDVVKENNRRLFRVVSKTGGVTARVGFRSEQRCSAYERGNINLKIIIHKNIL